MSRRAYFDCAFSAGKFKTFTVNPMQRAAPLCMKVWEFTVDAHKPARRAAFGKRVWHTTVLPNKQESLFALRGFRKARYRTFTEKDRTFRQNKSLKIISRKFKIDIDI